jgi:peptidoglycan hydrolase CwlO-like protein
MSFGSLGATGPAAVDNMAALLKIVTVMSETPADFIAQVKALLEDVAGQNTALKTMQAAIADQQAQLAQQQAVVQSKQDALDEHIAKLRKLTE